MFVLNGYIINWKASLQHVVALFTIESKCIVATKLVNEDILLKGLLAELGLRQKTVSIFCNSFSMLHWYKNLTHHETTKHIDIKLHSLRNQVSKKVNKMEKIHIDDNPLDMLVKVVPIRQFKKCLDFAGVCNFFVSMR